MVIWLHSWSIYAREGPDKGLTEYINKATKYKAAKNFDTAFLYYDSAIVRAKELGDFARVSDLYRLKGILFYQVSLFDSAINNISEAKAIAIDLSNDTLFARSNSNLGYMLLMKGMPDSAERFLRESLMIYESLEDTIGMARTNNLLSICYKHTQDYAKGIESGLKSSYYFKKLGQTRFYIRSLITLANHFVMHGDLDTAYSYYQRASELNKDFEIPANTLAILFNLAVCDYQKGEFFAAEGDTVSAQRNYLKAETIFLEAIEAGKMYDDNLTIVQSYNNLSSIYLKLNRYPEFFDYARKALQLAVEINYPREQVLALMNLGLAYEHIGDDLQSIKYYMDCIELAKEKEQTAYLSTYKLLSNVYLKTGDKIAAIRYLRLYIRHLESSYNAQKEKQFHRHQTDFMILQLRDDVKQKEIEKQRLDIEKQRLQLFFGLALFIVVTLSGLLIFIRMRAKKNRIIALQKIQQLEDEKKLLAAQSVIVGQENERKRIAQELHDGIGILLSTASIHVSGVSSASDGEEKAEMIKKANQLLKRAGREVRKISQNIMPGVLSKFGLKDAIEDLFDKVVETMDIEIEKQINCTNERLPENTEIMLYRIIQELINNTLKHANASKIVFAIDRKPTEIQIFYSDNGRGFDIDEVDTNKSLGLSGMRSRVDFLKGKLTLKSAPNKGTEYKIVFPVDS